MVRIQAPLVMKFTILVDSSFGHNYFVLNLSDPCPGVDKKGRRTTAHSPYGHVPTQEPLSRGS